MCFFLASQAQREYYEFKIFGTVYNTDKEVVPGWNVVISNATDVVTLTTNRNGEYSETFKVPKGTPALFLISVKDPCNNLPLVQKTLGNSLSEQHDFIICKSSTPGNNPCEVKFSFKQSERGSIIEFHAEPEYRGAQYLWNFGDGHTGEGKDVRHEYEKPGVYVVTLTVVLPNCKSEARQRVEVKMRPDVGPPPPYNVSAGCCGKINASSIAVSTSSSPYTFRFTASGDFRIREVTWDFGDGHTGTGTETTHSYDTVGKYNVTATLIGEHCTVILNLTVVAEDRKPPPSPCPMDFDFKIEGNKVLFEAHFKVRPEEFKWSFGDGTGSTDLNPSHEYAKEGEYKVTLHAVFNGVPCSITKIIKVGRPNNNPCNLDFKFEQDATNGVKFKLTFTVIPDKINWEFGDGTSSSDVEPYHVYAKPGVYKVTVTAVFGTRICTFSKEIKVGSRIQDPTIEIYNVDPNPANAEAIVYIRSSEKTDATLTIVDLSGVILIKLRISLEQGENKFPVDVQNLPSGYYLVYLYYENDIVSKWKFQKI